MDIFFRYLRGIGFCILIAPMIIGFLVMVSKKDDYYSPKERSVRQETSQKDLQNNYNQQNLQLKRLQQLMEEQKQNNTLKYQNRQSSRQYSVFTPDDAYNEGYDEGYDQGRSDGANGRSNGYGYDDSSNYVDYYEIKYQEGV